MMSKGYNVFRFLEMMLQGYSSMRNMMKNIWGRRVLNRDWWRTAESYKQSSMKLQVSCTSWSLSYAEMESMKLHQEIHFWDKNVELVRL